LDIRWPLITHRSVLKLEDAENAVGNGGEAARLPELSGGKPVNDNDLL
jgi:hypothetical protein